MKVTILKMIKINYGIIVNDYKYWYSLSSFINYILTISKVAQGAHR